MAFALRKHLPRAEGQVFAFDLAEDALGLSFVVAREFAPKIDHRVFTAGDGKESRLVVGHHLANGGADDADVEAELAPIRSPKSAAKDRDAAGCWGHVAG